MTDWTALKEAFWAATDAPPSERPRLIAALTVGDPELARRLEVLLIADARGESLQQIFEAGPGTDSTERPFRLGAYAVTGVLGVGGMGEVYRARDTRLNREVAIKVLPAAVIDDPRRLARFEREAQVLASLNHPHIAQLYGLEESASTPALVMELVEGPTLVQLIESCRDTPIALPRVLEIAGQIAAGLQAAHDKGVVHSDLKPGNVALTNSGDVKILDFGLANTREPTASHPAPPDADGGAVLGTPAYMSPEQARGAKVDERTDIWAFGCLLYELLTRRQAFAGLTPSDSLAAVLERNPDLTILPAGTPAAVRSLLDQCLEKDPARRLRDIAAARRVLEDAGRPPQAVATRLEGVGPVATGRRVLAAAAMLMLTLLPAAYWWSGSRDDEQLHAVPLTSLSGTVSSPTLSPDGNSVVFSWTGPTEHNPDLYVQRIDGGTPRRLTTDPRDDYGPGWSPDGRAIAFLRRDTLGGISEVRVMAVPDGAERRLGVIHPGLPFGGVVSLAWCPDSTCVLVTDSTGPGKPDALFAISVDGHRRQMTYPESLVADLGPAVAPDGRSLVFRRHSAPFSGAIYRLALDEKTRPQAAPVRLTSSLSSGTSTWTRDSRDIVFSARGALWRLDAHRGGTPVRLAFVGQDGQSPMIAGHADGSQRLVYIRSVSDSNVWRLSTAGPGAPASGEPVRAIASTRHDFTPGLSPDGRRMAFWSNRSGEPQIWTANIDGSQERQLTSIAFRSFPAWPRWSPDARWIAFHGDPQDRPDVLVVPAEGGKPLIATANLFSAAFPSFSRDGRSLYFCRWDGPETRIWKMPVTGGQPIRVTDDPGFVPIESPDGRLLYYVSAADRPGALWRSPTSGGTPVKVLDGVLFGNFDVIEGGIYYLEGASADSTSEKPHGSAGQDPGIRLQYYDLSTERSVTIAGSLGKAGHGLTVSRDGRSIFFARIDSAIDELMLVDGFR